MRTVKKYANRKLYDTNEKKYISMDHLADIIKAGEEVRILDNRSQKDITASIVSQLIARDKKDKNTHVPSGVLIQLLRKGGGTLADYAKKYAFLWQSAFTLAEDEIEKFINMLVKDKELSMPEARKLQKEIMGYASNLKEWITNKIDQRIDEVMNIANLASRSEVTRISEKLDDLAAKVYAMDEFYRKSAGEEKDQTRH